MLTRSTSTNASEHVGHQVLAWIDDNGTVRTRCRTCEADLAMSGAKLGTALATADADLVDELLGGRLLRGHVDGYVDPPPGP